MIIRIFSFLLNISFFLAITGSALYATDQPPARWTVQDAVHFAQTNNPDARIALQRIAATNAALEEAKSAFYPQLHLNAGYSRTNNPMYSFGNILNQGLFDNTIDFNQPGVTDNLTFGTEVRYRIYNGGHDLAGLEAADASAEVSQYQQKIVRSRLGFAAVQAFFTIIQAEETIAARKSAIAAIDASLSAAQARYEAGDLLRAELLDLEVQQYTARENFIQAKHGLNISQRIFLNLLGLQQEPVTVVTAARCRQVVPERTNGNERPERGQMTALVQAAEANVRQAQAGYYPTADAFASYRIDNGFTPEDGAGNSWMAGLKMNYSLFDGKKTAAAVRRAQAAEAEAKEQLHKIELAINLEIEKAALSLQQAEERLTVTGKMIELAEESARLSRIRFEEGLLLVSDLIDTENRLTDARIRHVLAQADQRIAVADLRRANGLPQFADIQTAGPAN